MVDIAFIESNMNFYHCGQYGHIWSAIHAFYAYITVHDVSGVINLPSPSHCPKKYYELARLFTNKKKGVFINLSRKVPLCTSSSTGPCDSVASRVFVSTVTDYHFNASLRSYVRRLHKLGWDNTKRITFVSNEHASNGRRIEDEQTLMHAIRSNFSRTDWHVHMTSLANMSYIAELRNLARSRVVVGLFGSNLHTCRFFTPNTVVVELHGALKNDFAHGGYWNLCNSRHNLTYAGVVDPHAVPELIGGRLLYRRVESRYTGRFSPTDILDAIHYGIRSDHVGMQRLYTKHLPMPFYDPRRKYDEAQVQRRYDSFIAATTT